MRVLHIITGLSIGGAERALFNLLSGNLFEGGETAVLSLSCEGHFSAKIRALGVPVYTMGMAHGLPTLVALLRLRRLVREFRPDLIQGWMYHGNLAASIAQRLAPGKPALLWNIRQTLYTLAEEKALTRQVIRVNRFCSAGADAIIYNSHVSRTLHEAFGFASERGRVIANGFDTGLLRPDMEKRQAMRRALGLAANVTLIGHVARFHPVKDHAGFLRAAIRIILSRPDAFFLLVGRNVSLENPALSGIVPAEFVDHFRCVGERDDVHDLMQAMDIFCLSSNSEAFPNVLAEAMCAGVPCVTTDVGDSRHIVGHSGIIVPPNDDASMARGLLEMMAKSEKQRSDLGRRARARIKKNFTLAVIVAEYIELYEKIISMKGNHAG
ncbi:MAG: glycosyltransferase [Gammaproteobacteria bacterium]|nr:glycosyltransferase [Gammaproteobacteria bacterium]